MSQLMRVNPTLPDPNATLCGVTKIPAPRISKIQSTVDQINVILKAKMSATAISVVFLRNAECFS